MRTKIFTRVKGITYKNNLGDGHKMDFSIIALRTAKTFFLTNENQNK
jgi:hypothetical protein